MRQNTIRHVAREKEEVYASHKSSFSGSDLSLHSNRETFSPDEVKDNVNTKNIVRRAEYELSDQEQKKEKQTLYRPYVYTLFVNAKQNMGHSQVFERGEIATQCP